MEPSSGTINVCFFRHIVFMSIRQPCPRSPTRGHAAADNHQTVMPGVHGWYTQAIHKEPPDWTLASAPRATHAHAHAHAHTRVWQCLFLVNITLYLPMIHWGNKCYPIHLSTYWCPLVYMQRWNFTIADQCCTVANYTVYMCLVLFLVNLIQAKGLI